MLNDPTHRPPTWLVKNEPLPDACIVCGMYTDRRVATRYIEHQSKIVSEQSNGEVAFGCLLHLLGPIGWIVAIVLQGMRSDSGQPKEKTVKVKSKIKVPVCPLCIHAAQPTPVDGNIETSSFAFAAHPRFVQLLADLRRAESNRE